MIAIPPWPSGVAIAAMVSSTMLVLIGGIRLFEFQRGALLGTGELFHSFFFGGNEVVLHQLYLVIGLLIRLFD